MIPPHGLVKHNYVTVLNGTQFSGFYARISMIKLEYDMKNIRILHVHSPIIREERGVMKYF